MGKYIHELYYSFGIPLDTATTGIYTSPTVLDGKVIRSSKWALLHERCSLTAMYNTEANKIYLYLYCDWLGMGMGFWHFRGTSYEMCVCVDVCTNDEERMAKAINDRRW